jgi:hypothetical protein
MSKLPSQGYVTVALNNLEPAEDETRLTYIGVENGMACYSFNPTQTTETLKLKNTAVGVEAAVRLSAYHFEDAEKSMTYTANKFENLTFNPSVIYNKVNQNVAFSFNMTNMPTSDVTVVLTYLIPNPTTETRLTLTKDEGNVKYYTFKPTALNNTLQLQNTASGVIAEVQLSATDFPDAEKTMNISNKYVIPANSINVDHKNIKFSTTLYIYSSSNSSKSIGSFKTTSNNNGNIRYNSDNIELSLTQEQYQAVIKNGGTIYIKYTSDRITYTATANLQKLLEGETVTLNNWSWRY